MARLVLRKKILPATFFLSSLITVGVSAQVTDVHLEQAKRIHERLTGAQPSATLLNDMAALIEGGNGVGAAELAIQSGSEGEENFLSVTVKNWAAPWTNRDQDVFVPFNDYTATVVGYAKAGADFRGILYDNLIGISEEAGVPAYSSRDINNEEPPGTNHYEYLESQGLVHTVVLRDQAQQTGLPAEATAGVITTNAAAQAFFVDGTNRAMFRFTLLNHMCMDLEQLHDTSLPPDRIRQDVSRSPGGDSRVFANTCVGCHSLMDPLTQAFAYYDYDNDTEDTEGQARNPNFSITYNGVGTVDPITGTRVDKKNWNGNGTFPQGYVTQDDRWDNYMRGTANDYLGWNDGPLNGNGVNQSGAKSLGMELAYSDRFAQCQVEKVFKNVCLRDPVSTQDIAFVRGEDPGDLLYEFRTSTYNIRTAFAHAANYCKEP